jgi:hypothetical protein
MSILPQISNLNSITFIENNITRFQTTVDQSEAVQNFVPRTISAIAIAFTINIHQNGRTERTSFNESLRVDNLAIFSSFDALERTNRKGAAMHGCVRFTIFSLDFTTFLIKS